MQFGFESSSVRMKLNGIKVKSLGDKWLQVLPSRTESFGLKEMKPGDIFSSAVDISLKYPIYVYEIKTGSVPVSYVLTMITAVL